MRGFLERKKGRGQLNGQEDKGKALLQEVAGQVKGSALHVSWLVHVLAEDLGQRGLAELSQLGLREARMGIVVLIPKEIRDTVREVFKGPGNVLHTRSGHTSSAA